MPGSTTNKIAGSSYLFYLSLLYYVYFLMWYITWTIFCFHNVQVESCQEKFSIKLNKVLVCGTAGQLVLLVLVVVLPVIRSWPPTMTSVTSSSSPPASTEVSLSSARSVFWNLVPDQLPQPVLDTQTESLPDVSPLWRRTELHLPLQAGLSVSQPSSHISRLPVRLAPTPGTLLPPPLVLMISDLSSKSPFVFFQWSDFDLNLLFCSSVLFLHLRHGN